MTKRPPNLIQGLVSFQSRGKHHKYLSSVGTLTALDERTVQIPQLQSQEFQAEVNEPGQPSARTTLFIMDLNNSALK